MKKLILFCLLLSANFAFAQDFLKYGFTQAQIEAANTAKDAQYLSEKEKQVILICNLARMQPKVFAKNIRRMWVENSNNDYGQIENLDQNKWFISLLRDLQAAAPAQALLPDPNIHKAAAFHAKDAGEKGLVGHESSDGTSFAQRVDRFADNIYAENCDYGNDVPLEIVMSLLVDQDVASLGHRKNILNAGYKYIGVAIDKHTEYGYNCVMDFGM